MKALSCWQLAELIWLAVTVRKACFHYLRDAQTSFVGTKFILSTIQIRRAPYLIFRNAKSSRVITSAVQGTIWSVITKSFNTESCILVACFSIFTVIIVLTSSIFRDINAQTSGVIAFLTFWAIRIKGTVGIGYTDVQLEITNKPLQTVRI